MTNSSSLTIQYEQGAYLSKVPDWHLGDSPWKAGKVFEILDRNGIRPGSVCDVGCGAGGILAALQSKLSADVELVGYDISPQAIAMCKRAENERLKYRQCDFLKECDNHHDLLLCLDVFEHVPDYLGFLEALRSRAKWFVFHIPLDVNVHTVFRRSDYLLDMRSRYGHLHYFTSETAIATLTDLGYKIVDQLYTWDGEIDGPPRLRPGLKACLAYPRRWLGYQMERFTFQRNPRLAACKWQQYNLMVVATPV